MEFGEKRWAREEFGNLGTLDVRLRRRVLLMAERLAADPAGRVSDVYTNAAERQGAYDLLEGNRVRAETLIASSAGACVERGRRAQEVFVPIDSTTIHVVDRKKKTDLGLVGTHSNDARGLNVVTALGVSMGGVPLGIAAQTWWRRPPERRKRVSHSTYRPVDERESRHFVETIRAVESAYESSNCRPWMVIDRGGDAVVIIDELMKSGARFTVRASWDRKIQGQSAHRYVRSYVKASPVALRYRVRVPAGYRRRKRTAHLEVRVARVRLNFSHDWQAQRESPLLNVVWVLETACPSGERPLNWMLYTNAPVRSANMIAKVICSYTTRWRIEDFHKTWKSGHCRVEETQLRSCEAVKTWATLLATVAARVERLKHLSRTEPDVPASSELSETEIQALKLLKLRQKKRTETIPEGVPPMALAVRWIADLGGYTGKSSGGPPGGITIGRGWEKVQAAAEALEGLEILKKERAKSKKR